MKFSNTADLIYELMYHNHLFTDKEVWCIGDVHGHNSEFVELIERIRSRNPEAVIVQLGDLIDRGPDFIEVFQTINDYGVISLIGNHELNFIQELHGYKRCRSKERLKNHEKFNQLSSENKEFVVNSINSMLNYITVETRNDIWFLSHAPSVSKLDIGLDCGNASNFCMGNVPYPQEFKNCVHGHQHWAYTPIEEQLLNNTNMCFNVDGGCCYENGSLIALELNSKQVLSVKGPLQSK
jgi:predicted MPP superfamily phosphohydrolase